MERSERGSGGPGGVLTYRKFLIWLVAYLAMGALFFFALRSPVNGFWYPPVALGRAALLLFGWGALPLVVVGELGLMVLQYEVVAGQGFGAAVVVAVATVVECVVALVGARWMRVEVKPKTSKELGKLTLVVGLVPSVVGAVLGVVGLWWIGAGASGPMLPRMSLWALGNFVTVATLLPALLIFGLHGVMSGDVRGGMWAALVRSPMKGVEAVGLLLASVGSCVVAARHMTFVNEYNLKFVCFLPLIWAGIRFGMAGAAVAVAVQSSVWALLYGQVVVDSFPSLVMTLMQVQMFNLAMGLGGLTLAAAVSGERANRRRAEEAAEKARLAAQARDRFLSVLSHELKTPLTPAMLYAESLAGDKTLPAEVRETGELIREQIRIQSKLVGDLLDLSSLRFKKMEVEKERVDVGVVATEVVEAWRGRAEAAGIRMVIMAGEGMEARADGKRLGQALRALVDNAVKFTKSGGEVRVSVVRGGGMVRVMVDDTGVGIDPKRMDEVFEAFVQPDRTLTSEASGVGLGMPIAHGLAVAMGGTLKATSAGEGRGMHVELSVPVWREG